MHSDHVLDARGLLCPLPVLKARFALDGMAPGEVLKVLSTDGGSVLDMEAFARQADHELLASTVGDGEYVFHLRKGGPAASTGADTTRDDTMGGR